MSPFASLGTNSHFLVVNGFYCVIHPKVYVKANQDDGLKTQALAYFAQMEAG